MEFHEIQVLEEKLNKLLGYIERLRQEKEGLKEALATKERENEALKAELERLKQEREEVKTRVKNLLERIDQVAAEG